MLERRMIPKVQMNGMVVQLGLLGRQQSKNNLGSHDCVKKNLRWAMGQLSVVFMR